jgi:16S rRNA (cytosine967-C5)-methyltransferase
MRLSRSSPLQTAAAVVSGVDRDHPADAMLRQEFKSQRGLSQDQKAQITRAVFSYFRWRGWLGGTEDTTAQIRKALELAERFARQPESFIDEELVARALPTWVKDEMEVTAPLARSLQSEPKLWLRAKRGQGTAVATRLGDCRTLPGGELADTLEYRGTRDLFLTQEFHSGQFELQDLSSQAVGFICAPVPGQTWWDACAGEGGKLLHLSDLMQNRGLIWASDRASWRLQKLKRRAARAQAFNYRSVPWNGGPKLPTKTTFDGVLLDAPCTGSGTWQRNPDGRWTTTSEGVRELSELQNQLLAHVAAAVKPGGKLVYAVCSLMHSETTLIAQTFEQRFGNFEPLEFPNPLEFGSSCRTQLALQPNTFGGNGMFVAAWRRK